MLDLSNKKIFFSGFGEQVPKKELETYLIQKGSMFVNDMAQANLLIEGYRTNPDISEEMYKAKKLGTQYLEISVLEKQYSQDFKINNTLMAIKLTKNMDRLLLLLKNRYFTDETFVQLLKFYDWKNTILYEDDCSRDICTRITQRFCKKAITNHNIQYSPIGIYYTALETTNGDLLEQIYCMPDYTISDKNARENQPLSLKEVVALNPNISLALQQQIFSNNRLRELTFLAANINLLDALKIKLKEKNIDEITLSLIHSGNYIFDDFTKEKFQKEILQFHPINEKNFESISNVLTQEIQWIYLSTNSSLDTQMLDFILEKNIDNATINVLKNSNVSKKAIQKYLKMNDKVFNIALAHNSSLSQEQYRLLLNLNDMDINVSLASNDKVPQEILKELFQVDNHFLHECLASNINTPFEILMQLMLDTSHKMKVTENPTYKEKIKQTIGHMTC